jgi:hypothetical protein
MLGLFRRKPPPGCVACRALAGDIAALQCEVARLQRAVIERDRASSFLGPGQMLPEHIPAYLRGPSAG